MAEFSYFSLRNAEEGRKDVLKLNIVCVIMKKNNCFSAEDIKKDILKKSSNLLSENYLNTVILETLRKLTEKSELVRIDNLLYRTKKGHNQRVPVRTSYVAKTHGALGNMD